MKFVLHSCLLLVFLFSYSPKKTNSSNLTVQLQQPDSFQYIAQLHLQHNQSLSLALDITQPLTLTQTCNGTFGSSYSPIRCNETECLEFFVELNNSSPTCARSSTCDYEFPEYEYNGTLSKVSLNGFPDFVLGCGDTAEGARPRFGYDVDGVLGLGRGQLSFLAQTNNTRFSYCLPSSSNSTGYFTFGAETDDDDALFSFTPLIQPRAGSNYVVDIVAININGTQLPIAYENITGTIIDTWSPLTTTQLPHDAYVAMRDEFAGQMGTYPIASPVSPFDTCYYIDNLSSLTVPPVSFTFKDSVTVDFASGILYAAGPSLFCFAFTQASDPKDFVIFASAQQRTLEMVFDVANDKLGFRQNGCA